MSTSALADRQASLRHLQDRLPAGAGPHLVTRHRSLDGLTRREYADLSCFMLDATAVIVAALHAAGALSAGTAAPVDLLETTPDLVGVDLDFILDRLTTEGVLGMSSVGGADDRYWIS